MWRRCTAREIAKAERLRVRSRQSPVHALLLAAFFTAILFVGWVLGIPGRGSQRLSNPKSWSEVRDSGPQRFGGVFAISFIVVYTFRRFSRSRIGLEEKPVFICPRCHTAQHADARRCNCDVNLEPIEMWKWV
jgi:hypothetical protein